jgi:hypothetical protein
MKESLAMQQHTDGPTQLALHLPFSLRKTSDFTSFQKYDIYDLLSGLQ